MKYFSQQKQLPSKEEMLEDTQRDMERRWAQGYKKRQAHMMGPFQVCWTFSRLSLLSHFLHNISIDFNTMILHLFHLQNEYYDDLSKTAGIENLKPVMTKLHNDSCLRFLEDLANFRKDVYRIIDDETFIKIKG